MYACSRLADSDKVGNGGSIEQFMDRCIWNWVAVALEIAVMASVAAVPHTMLQPRYWHSWQSRAGLVLHILPRGLGGPGRGTAVVGWCVRWWCIPVQSCGSFGVAWEKLAEYTNALS